MNRQVIGGIRVLAFVGSIALGAVAHAQVTTGTVSGVVKDSSGGVLPGASVTLVNSSQGTRSNPVFTDRTGEFVFPNVAAATYTIEVSLPSFKTLQRAGIDVSPASRVAVGTLTLELGGASETVTVTGEAPVIQAASGERSFTIPTSSVENLPIGNRNFISLTSLAPGVSGNARIGGGGANNTMIDGVSALDTGGTNVIVQVSVESIQEVKVLTSGYQAEYGRSSGLQIVAVTKSGTNQFRGSLYDVERNSDWNVNSRTNTLNGDPKLTLKQRDLGYSIGGPIGRPGGRNKLFFFYAHEFAPRSQGGTVNRFRVPTALERAGDFSRTYDNNGALFPFIKDPQLPGACSAANTAGCFSSGGVIGRIPSSRFYGPGAAILNLYPMPNLDGAGLAYNYEEVQPIENARSTIPTVRIDYQPTSALRVSWKWSGFTQATSQFRGTLAGITESSMYKPSAQYTTAVTVNYTLNSRTFIEGTLGGSQNLLTGCALAAAGAQTGPAFCTSGIPVGALSNLDTAGLSSLPTLFSASPVRQDYFAYEVLSGLQPPMFVNGLARKTPNFAWGGRVANGPPNVPYPGFLNRNSTRDIVVSLTHLAGRHTLKTGIYNQHALKVQNSGNPFATYNFQNSTNNPIDSGFPFSNAILGIINSYSQQSAFLEGAYVYDILEGYVQDSWRVNNRLTLDYGLRLVHQSPIYDERGQASNFLPERYDPTQAPVLYVAGCANGAVTCTGTNRQALNPLTGVFLGSGSSVAIGTLVPGNGNSTNGIFLAGQGIANTNYVQKGLVYGPRIGAAYDVSGKQRLVFRGSVGLFYDQRGGGAPYQQISNPPTSQNATVNFANLASPLSGTSAAPALTVFKYDPEGLPLQSSLQWSSGAQLELPWSSALDVAYVGQHSWNQHATNNINAVDFGTAFLPQSQDRTQTPTFLGSNTVPVSAMRAFRGYAAINQTLGSGWETFHSIQFSVQRRFRHGFSLGFNDTWSLYDHMQSGARLEHLPDGTYRFRADQAEADALLQQDPVAHTLKANFVWKLPDLRAGSPGRRWAGFVVNDWQLSGVWSASTGAPYTIGYNYQNGGTNANLTGSQDYAARIRVVGDPGAGCSNDVYRQFNNAAFAGPQPGSVGLESGANYLRGCFQSALDLSLARVVRLGGSRQLQFRLDVYNAPNQAAITGRVTTLQLTDPTDPVTPVNSPFDSAGALIANRSQPKNAGFGVASGYQAPRTIQARIRFSF